LTAAPLAAWDAFAEAAEVFRERCDAPSTAALAKRGSTRAQTAASCDPGSRKSPSEWSRRWGEGEGAEGGGTVGWNHNALPGRKRLPYGEPTIVPPQL
jgi:hypothetical protein